MLVRRNSLVPAARTVGLDRLFQDLFEDVQPASSEWDSGYGRIPAIDTREDEKNYYVEAELPGLTDKDVEIAVLGNELRLTGGHEDATEEKATYHRRERRYGKFSRVIRFPVDLDDSKVTAVFKHGVLEITLPKAQAALPRRIEVRTS